MALLTPPFLEIAGTALGSVDLVSRAVGSPLTHQCAIAGAIPHTNPISPLHGGCSHPAIMTTGHTSPKKPRRGTLTEISKRTNHGHDFCEVVMSFESLQPCVVGRANPSGPPG